MATSNAHKLGQIIGDTLELAIYPPLKKFATDNRLYLDIKGIRSARPTKKLTWLDINENKHDLDFVLERGGTESIIGDPVAFIESAWRRYTKHSKNKAQEIQGALDPLAEKYKHIKPLKGAIVAGEFTGSSLDQLRSLGFGVVYASYFSIVEAFKTQGVNIAFDEDTSEEDLGDKVDACEALTKSQLQSVADAMLNHCKFEMDEFINKLEEVVSRTVIEIRITPPANKQ